MTQRLRVQHIEDDRRSDWARLVSASPEGSIYSVPEYLEALCEATGGHIRLLGVYSGAELIGGIALYEEGRPYGKIVCNRLLLYYNGVVLRDYDTQHESERLARRLGALSAIVEHLSSLSYVTVTLHCRALHDARPFMNSGWTVQPTYTFVVPITDLEKAWTRVDQNLRRLVRRAQDAGLTMTDDDDFAEFYRLHEEVHRRKGAPLYLAARPFERYFRRLRAAGLCRLLHARLATGQPVASQLVLLGPHHVSHTVCAAADGSYLSLGTTPFLRWHAFCRLAELGYAANDLTDASLNSVTRFKSQLGGNLSMNLMVTRGGGFRVRSYERSLRMYHAFRSRAGRLYRTVRPRRASEQTG